MVTSNIILAEGGVSSPPVNDILSPHDLEELHRISARHNLKNGSTIVAIDGSNFKFACKALGFKADLEAFREILNMLFNLRRVYFYHSIPHPVDSKDHSAGRDFGVWLSHNGYNPVTVPARSPDASERPRRPQIEVMMSNQLIMQANQVGIDNLVIISSDRDFVDTAEHIKSLGKRVIVISTARDGGSAHVVSNDLASTADIFLDLTSFAGMFTREEIEE